MPDCSEITTDQKCESSVLAGSVCLMEWTLNLLGEISVSWESDCFDALWKSCYAPNSDFNNLDDCPCDLVGMNNCWCWYSRFECLSMSRLSRIGAVVCLMTFWSTRGWVASWVCCGHSSMNYVEVGFNSWWFVFSSSPVHLRDLARTEVILCFWRDLINLSTFRNYLFPVFWIGLCWIGWMICGWLRVRCLILVEWCSSL